MIVNDNIDVIVDVGILGILIIKSNGKSSSIVLLLSSIQRKTDSSRGKIINDPVVVVTPFNVNFQSCRLQFINSI